MAEVKESNNALLILLIIVVVILLSSLAFLLTPYAKKFLPKVDKDTTIKQMTSDSLMDISFLTLPDVVVNLRNARTNTTLLRCTFVLELYKPTEKGIVDKFRNVIIDQFQNFLRELRADDLQGSVGLERIRQELFIRVNDILKPKKVQIKNFLIKGLLVQ